jgi:hypothetical protein
MRLTRVPLAVLLALLLLPMSATADPRAPVTTAPAPEDQGDIFSPGVRLVSELEQAYLEEEFFVTGEATLYTYEENPRRGVLVPLLENVPYTTRIIVRRPEQAQEFNGTVIIEWWNSTAGFDTAPVWDPSAEYFAREGIIYVGVTNSTTSIEHLAVNGCSLMPGLMPETCGNRYAVLSLPENGVAFEMVSQIANLLKSDSLENPLPADFDVERIFHSGQSQQGGSMVTYASAFHFDVNDGYFVQAASTARRINYYPACGEPDSPDYPDCTPQLEGDDRLVRTDLPVPVYRSMTETDVGRVLEGETRQEDTENFRYYEVAGTAHVTVHKDVEFIPAIPPFIPDPLYLEDACRDPLNTLADGPVFGSHIYNAMWRNMEWQVRFGISPPHGDLIETELDENDELQIARDEFDNALGGIRPVQMRVPIASYGPRNSAAPDLPWYVPANLTNLFCYLSGTVADFDAVTLDELYPTHANYVAKVSFATFELEWRRFLLHEDARQLRIEAIESDIGNRPCCGLGYELVFAVPALLAIRRWRRSTR